MDERVVFVQADRALLRVVEQVRDDQWQMNLPEWFQRSATQRDVTLREVINYHAYDDAWVPYMVAGQTMEEAGRERFGGDLLSDDPKGRFAAIVETACSAVTALDDLDRIVHTSFGDYPAREYLWQITSFRGLRAHDIAKFIGVETRLPHNLVQGLWDEISPNAEEWRAIGVYPAAIAVPEGAPLQDRLLGLTGREPDAEEPHDG